MQVESSSQYANRALGGRPADWRSWEYTCPATGETIRFDQRDVVDEIARDSALPAQAAPLRLFDRGTIRATVVDLVKDF